MSKHKRKGGKLPPFVPVIKTTMATPAWRAMSFGARLLYIELRGRLRNDYLNNGKVFLSCRDAAKAIGVTTTAIVHWYAENEHFGFLRKTGNGFLGVDGYGVAARYRFTEFRCDGHPPTREFEKWAGKPFVYTPRRPSRKKQNPVLRRHTPRVTPSHIDSAPGCVTPSHTSRRASREAPSNQGSSTARAPAQAGDVGSNPAPEAKPGDERS